MISLSTDLNSVCLGESEMVCHIPVHSKSETESRNEPCAVLPIKEKKEKFQFDLEIRVTMSALHATNASAVVISDEMIAYFEVGLSILTMLTNIVNFFCVRKWLVSSVVYQIQQIDSLVTAVCQIGYIGILLSSISDTLRPR